MMTRRVFLVALSLITLATLVRVAATHRVFAQVLDEPAHLIAGFAWLNGDYRDTDIEHPPLARVVAAIPFYFEGRGAPIGRDWNRGGNSLLLDSGTYEQNLALARRGNLLFLIGAIIAVAAWGARAGGDLTALIAALLYVSLPPVLGHAGVATTDMAAGATLPLALLALSRWLERRTWTSALLMGLGAGLGLISKFSFVLFFAAGAIVIVVIDVVASRHDEPAPASLRRTSSPVRNLAQLALAAAFAVIVLWAGYRFEFGTVASTQLRAREFAGWVFEGKSRDAAIWLIERVPVPAPLFFNGILQVKLHDVRGHAAFLLGRTSTTGWWYYFPVALAVKTPLPFLILAVAAVFWRSPRTDRRRVLEAAAVASAILLAAMTASINIGIRHLLPLFVPAAVVAAAGFDTLWNRGKAARAAATLLVAWAVAGSAAAHPDYLPWFNALAGRHPEGILSDSNLDWGQDVLRLRRALRDAHVQRLDAALFTSADLGRLGFPPRRDPDALVPGHGWLALSETTYAMLGGARGSAFWWLRDRPYVRVGKSIRLYRVP